MVKNIVGSLLIGLMADIQIIIYAYITYCILYTNLFEEGNALIQMGIGPYFTSHLQWDKYAWIFIAYSLIGLVVFFIYRLFTYRMDDLTSRINMSLSILVVSYVYIAYPIVPFQSLINHCLMITLTLIPLAVARLIYECVTREQLVNGKIYRSTKPHLHLV